MKIEDFLNTNNTKYRIQVIAPTHTYGTLYSLESQFDFNIDFDEYDKDSEWEYNLIIDDEIIASFGSIENINKYFATINNSTK